MSVPAARWPESQTIAAGGRLFAWIRLLTWPAWMTLAGIVVGGAILRFWHLAAGFPYRIGVDEPVIAERAVHIMRTGDFNPHFFDYPGLYIYVQVMVGCLRYLKGAVDGSWQSLDQFAPDQLFLWARVLNATIGTLTILVVYRAGLRWGRPVAMLAALLIAVWPNHVRESHFALTDVPLTLFTTLVLVLSLRALETGRLAWFLAAGACVGFAAATKYNGGEALIMPLFAAADADASRRSRLLGVLGVVGAAGVAFLCGAPYTVLDLPNFLNSFSRMMALFSPRPFVDGASIYLAHLRIAVGWPMLFAAGAGMLWGAFRAIKDREIAKWSILLVFPAAFFHLFATKELIFARYLLPIVPFLSLVIAVVMVDLLRWMQRMKQPPWIRSSAAAVFTGVMLFHPVSEGIAWPIRHGRPVTQDKAYAMIRQFIPVGASVAIERSVLRLPASLYRGVDFSSLSQHSRQEYLDDGITYIVASSDVFGRILARPGEYPDAYQRYQSLFHEKSECLAPVQPTSRVRGPQIIICRLLVD